MKNVCALVLALSCAAPALACDKVDAARMQAALSEMGTQWSEQAGVVNLEWGREWDGTAAAQRLGLLRAFAEGDSCLAGRAREIAFYRQGKLVGRSGIAGIQLLDTTPPRKTPAC